MPHNSQPKTRSVVVWDFPTRSFHWLLAATFFYSWFSVDILEDMDQHFYAGYTALTLILFRFGWGIVGSYHSRFNNFPLGAAQIRGYLKSFLSKTSQRYLGHNPLGSLSALFMLLLILLQTLSGLFSSDGYYVYGPLAEGASKHWVSLASNFHALNVNLLFFIVALHIVAIIFYQIYKKENLTKAMLTGRKIITQDQLNVFDEGGTRANTKYAIAKSLSILLCVALLIWVLVKE